MVIKKWKEEREHMIQSLLGFDRGLVLSGCILYDNQETHDEAQGSIAKQPSVISQFIQPYMLIFNIPQVLYGMWLPTSHQSSQRQWLHVSDLLLKLCAPWDTGFRPPSDQRVSSKMVSNVRFL